MYDRGGKSKSCGCFCSPIFAGCRPGTAVIMSIADLRTLRQALHGCPELSGHEERTRAMLMEYLTEHTTLELCPCGGGFYAAHREAAGTKPSIALRADFDALPLPGGGAAHLCGHDGHAAALCGAAAAIDGESLGRNVFFLFQPAEETGAGALGCLELFQKERVDQIYGLHNLPGLPLGQVYTRTGTFACASRGITLSFVGRPTHAAYPENGLSPAPAVGRLLCALPQLSDPGRYGGITLCTVIGASMGERAFGSAAAQAEVWLTLRAERDEDLERLAQDLLHLAEALAGEYGLRFDSREQDVFPATVNHPGCARRVLELCGGELLESPMRWSEDFGHYLRRCPGAFFGIGAGETCPPLHTAGYQYPDGLLEPSVAAFLALLRG